MHPLILASLATRAMTVADAPPPGQAPWTRPFGFEASGTCGSASAGIARGKPLPELVLRRAREAPRSIRILRAGDSTTMDFLHDRLTIIVDNEGRVIATRCG